MSANARLRDVILPKELEAAALHDRLLALILISFPTLKEINATRGYAVGDRMLQQALSNIEAFARNDDCLVAASGAKFCLILPLVEHEAVLEMVLCRLDDELSAAHDIDSESIFMPAKLGASYSTGKDIAPDDLLRATELALSVAAESTQNWNIVEPQASNRGNLNDLQSELRSALEKNHLRLFFQPQVTLGGRRCVGFEALTRWPHEKGWISPNVFIPYAERSDLIQVVTNWTLHNAIRQLKELDQQYSAPVPLSVSLNVSGRCLTDDFLYRTVANALAIWDLNPDRLIIELTETAFVKDLEGAAKACALLRRGLGVKISLDDFGMGYSGLEILQKVEVDELKIDRSFIAKLCSDSRSQHIVRALINLANSLGIKTVAEGIEDAETLGALRAIPGHLGQGYLFSKPLREPDIIPWLREVRDV